MVHKLRSRTALYLKICLIHCCGNPPFSATPLSFSLPGVFFNYEKQIGYLSRYHVKLKLWNLCLTEILAYKSKYKFHSVSYSYKNKHFPLFTLWQYPLLDIGVVAAEKATAATKLSSSNSGVLNFRCIQVLCLPTTITEPKQMPVLIVTWSTLFVYADPKCFLNRRKTRLGELCSNLFKVFCMLNNSLVCQLY